MGVRLQNCVRWIRQTRGSHFLSRVLLRIKFDPSKPSVPDSPENVKAITEACRELGLELEEGSF